MIKHIFTNLSSWVSWTQLTHPRSVSWNGKLQYSLKSLKSNAVFSIWTLIWPFLKPKMTLFPLLQNFQERIADSSAFWTRVLIRGFFFTSLFSTVSSWVSGRFSGPVPSKKESVDSVRGFNWCKSTLYTYPPSGSSYSQRRDFKKETFCLIIQLKLRNFYSKM